MGSYAYTNWLDCSPKRQLFNLTSRALFTCEYLNLWLAACLAIVIADRLHADFGFLPSTPWTRRPINKEELAEPKEEPTQEPHASRRELPEAGR